MTRGPDRRARLVRVRTVTALNLLSVESAKIRSVATDKELTWALEYNGYERFSHDMSTYYELLRPAISAYEATGLIPEWCGVDLLRAWAFYRQREHHNLGHEPMAPDWDDVLDAIRKHPAANESDLPPDRLPRFAGEWAARLRSTIEAPYWSELMEFIGTERPFTRFSLRPIRRSGHSTQHRTRRSVSSSWARTHTRLPVTPTA